MSGIFRSKGRSRGNMARMGNGSRGRRGGLGSSASRGSSAVVIPHPPPIRSYGIIRDVRLRFSNPGGVFQAPITYQNLLDTVLIAATATTGFDLFDAVRVNAVEVWGMPAIGAAATVELTYNGFTVGASGDQKLHTDTSMGVEPAHVRASPDPLTQAGQFQPSSTAVAFSLALPVASVVDVSMTLRQPLQGNAVAAQNALVAASAGVVYYRGLDGKASATTSLPVVGSAATQ